MFKHIILFLCIQFFTTAIASNNDESTPQNNQAVDDEPGECLVEFAPCSERDKQLYTYLTSTSKAPIEDADLKEYIAVSAASFDNSENVDGNFYATVLAKLILEGNLPHLSKSKAIQQLEKLSANYCSAAFLLGQYYEGQLFNCNQRLLYTARRYYFKAQELGSNQAKKKIKKIDKVLVNQPLMNRKSPKDNDIEFIDALKNNWKMLSNKYRSLLNNKLPQLSISVLREEAQKGNEVAIGFWLCYLADHPEQDTQESKSRASKTIIASLCQLLEIEVDVPYISYIIGRLQQKNLLKGKDPVDAKPYLERAAMFGYEPALVAFVEYLETYEKDSEHLQEKYLQIAINKDYSPAIFKRAQLLESKYKWSTNKSEHRAIELIYQKAAKLNNPKATLRLAQLRQRSKKNAIPLYIKAAKLGSADAQFYLGLMYLDGVGINKSIKMAKYWLEKAASQGHKRSLYYLGELMLKEYNDIESAIKYYKQASENDVVPAMYSLAQLYLNGLGVSKNTMAGVALLSKAAKAGHLDSKKQLYKMQHGAKSAKYNIDFLTEHAKWGCPDSQFELAWCYYNGVGVKKDDEVSMDWLQNAATYRHPGAMYELGWKYHKGIVVAKNPEISTKWFIEAAEYSHVGAMYTLAHRYALGEGLEKPNNYMATKWFKRASAKGHARAMYHLACRYAAGEGVNKDVQKALELFLICLKKRYFRAIYPLWELCIKYEAELKHNTEVVEWLKEASESNNPTSQCFLGDLYFRGTFLQQDTEKAIHWYHKSASFKNTIALTRLGDIYNYLHPSRNKSMKFYETAAKRGSHLAQQRLSSHFDSISLVHKVNTLTRYMPQIDGAKQFLQNLNPFKPRRLKPKR